MAALHPTVGSSTPHQEALHSMTISNEAPEIAYSDGIKLDAACIVCTSLLETLDRYDVNLNLKVKFRLELLPKFNDLWAVRLKLDGVAWFDYLDKLMEDKEALAKIVRAYYDTCQRLGSPEVAQCFDERVAPKTYCINPYCIYKHLTGQRKQTSCHTICKGANLPTIMKPCSTLLARLDGSSPICYFFLFDEFVIRKEDVDSSALANAAAKGEFYLGNRREPTRDILLVPAKHRENRKLVTEQETWMTVNSILVELKRICDCVEDNKVVELIAVNFGKWETANSKSNQDDPGKFALDCHGHIHLHMTRNTINILSQFKGCSGLKGCVQNPENYSEMDSREIFQARLLPLEHLILQNGIAHVEKEVGGLKKEVQEVNGKVGGLKKEVQEVNGKVDELKTEMDELKKDMGELKTEVDGLRKEVIGLTAQMKAINDMTASILSIVKNQQH